MSQGYVGKEEMDHYWFRITVYEILKGKKIFFKNSQMTIKSAYKPH